MYVPYIPLVHLPVFVRKLHPNKKFNNVDLPAPFNPNNTTNSPGLISQLISFKIGRCRDSI